MKFLLIFLLASCVPNDMREVIEYVEVEKIVEVPVEVPVEVIKEVPVEVVIEVPVYIYPEPEPEPEAPPVVPVWTPSPGHVYFLDALDVIQKDYDAAALGMTYAALIAAATYNLEIHNVDFPSDPWHMVGGGP